MSVPEFDEVGSWQAAIVESLSYYIPEKGRVHALEKLCIIGFPDEIVSFPISGIG